MIAAGSDGGAAFLAEARRFAEEEVAPRAAEFDRAGELPAGLVAELGRRGYLGAALPVEVGGLGLDAVTGGLLTLAIGKACASTRAVLTVTGALVGETLARFGSPAQRRLIPSLLRGERRCAFALTEPAHGSDAQGIEARYTRRGGGFLLSGHKQWITQGAVADLFLVVARSAQDGALSVFVVEREQGLRTRPMQGLLAARAAGVAEVDLHGVEVDASAIVGEEGGGFFPVVSSALDAGRYSVAWGGQAIAEAALDAMTRYAREREQFGKRLADFQLVRELIAEATVQVHAGRALCTRAGALRQGGDPEAPVETTIAKYFTSRAAMRVATDAVQAHGANGCSDRYPVERLFREAKLLEIIEGATQILQRLISDHALGTRARR